MEPDFRKADELRRRNRSQGCGVDRVQVASEAKRFEHGKSRTKMHVPGKRKSQMVRESEKQGATTRHPSEWKREKKPENGATWRSEPSAAKSHCTKPARACGAHSGNGECALSAFSPLAFHEVARIEVFRRKNTPPTHPPQQPVHKRRNRPTFTPVCRIRCSFTGTPFTG